MIWWDSISNGVKGVFFKDLTGLTLTRKHSSDAWIDGNGEEVDGDDGREEDEEAGDGAAGDEHDQIGIVEEIFDALEGHVRQTRKLTNKLRNIKITRSGS